MEKETEIEKTCDHCPDLERCTVQEGEAGWCELRQEYLAGVE